MGIKVGDRFRPLENSPRYGPKYWKRDSEGTWVEQEMSKEERDFERLESTLLSADPTSPSVRSTPITEADAEKHPGLKSYVDGFAVFPSVPFYPQDHPEQIKLEDAWEIRSLDMHSRQQPAPPPPEKPADDSTTGRYFKELKRAD